MSQLYSVEQVAERLGLHVRTVRHYVREGRLKAVRLGKQYRIAAEDLAAMTGRPAASFEPVPERRTRHVEVSSIVEIDAISADDANRLINSLVGAAKGRHPSQDTLRIETVYNEERARLKIIVMSGPSTTATMLSLMAAILEAPQ